MRVYSGVIFGGAHITNEGSIDIAKSIYYWSQTTILNYGNISLSNTEFGKKNSYLFLTIFLETSKDSSKFNTVEITNRGYISARDVVSFTKSLIINENMMCCTSQVNS